MGYANIIAVLSGAPDDAFTLATAAELTHACGGETRVLLAPSQPDMRHWSFITPAALGPALRDARNAVQAARSSVEALTRELSVENALDLEPTSGRIRLIGEYPSDGPDLYGELPLCDLLVLGLGVLATGNVWETLVSRGLMIARTPLLVANHGPVERPAPAMIGWDGSHEAGRAVRAAVPLLKAASRVVIFQDPDHIPPDNRAAADPQRLRDYLRLHGVDRVTTLIAPGASRRNGLARAAASEDAELLVTGAFGHARLREEIFGGLTQDLLAARAPFNLFMRH